VHRIGIGDPQRLGHQPFAEFGIGMVDAKSMWQQLDARGRGRSCGNCGLTGCGWYFCLVEVWIRGHVVVSSGMMKSG
jgi:hypothetical protein